MIAVYFKTYCNKCTLNVLWSLINKIHHIKTFIYLPKEWQENCERDDSCEQAAPQKQTRSYLIWINKIIYILTFSPSLLISFSRSLPFSLSQSCIRIDTQLFISCISLSLLRTYRHTQIFIAYISSSYCSQHHVSILQHLCSPVFEAWSCLAWQTGSSRKSSVIF